MSKIGVLSDTHNRLRKPVTELLQSCDAIIHAGDFGTPDIFHQLQSIAPLYAVRGNVDKDWATNLPKTLSIEQFGLNILIVHNRKTIPESEDLSHKDLIIYGHSHKYEEIKVDGRTWLNPGSCGPKRFLLPVTMAIIHISKGHGYQIERIDFPSGKESAKNITTEKGSSPENIRIIVQNVMKETDKGKSVTDIAKKNQIDEDLATLICRLYLTHPGVDVDGILKKMGL